MRLAEIIIAVALVGCGPNRRGELVGAPVTPDDQDEKRGERLFYRFCATCHPHGEGGLGPSLNNKPLPEKAIETQIREGIGDMPAFSARHISDADVEAIADYVTELRGSR